MIERIEYLGWPHCVRVRTPHVDLIATTDVGPRIIHFGPAEGANLFKVFDDQAGLRGGEEWRIYGGQRLWHAPERKPWTYAADNFPIEWRAAGEALLILHQPAHALTSIAKTIEITASNERPEVAVLHRLTYVGAGSVELAPWALTALPPGGTAILPLPPRGSHKENLLPVGSLSLWAYTDLTDARLALGRDFIRVHQDAHAQHPFKIGLGGGANWCAYEREGITFIKRFQVRKSAPYPDLGAQVEVFTDHDMLELETLGPLVTLQQGESTEHEETWEVQLGFSPIGER